MDKIEEIPDKQYIFGSLLVVANRMDTLLERELKEFGVTSKQWFLSMIIDNVFDTPPTIKEVAKEMGTSHQNVKQVALKLQEKGLLKIEKDKKDARVTRLKLVDKSYLFWKKIQPTGMIFTEEVFKEIEKEDLVKTKLTIKKMLVNLLEMENKNDKGID